MNPYGRMGNQTAGPTVTTYDRLQQSMMAQGGFGMNGMTGMPGMGGMGGMTGMTGMGGMTGMPGMGGMGGYDMRSSNLGNSMIG